nr:putative methyl-CpG-binding domain protein 3-like 5 [Cavia porcellus]
MIPPHVQKKQVDGPKVKHRAAVTFIPADRLTNCIFRSRVTLVTAHPGNEVWRGLQEKELEKPQQLCAGWRLQAIKSQGTEEEQLAFKNTFKILTVGNQGGFLGKSDVESMQPAPGLPPFWKEMLPEALRLLPDSSHQQVTDIQRQTWKVKEARERLAKALQADRLAREAERMSNQEESSENQKETGAETTKEPQK